MASPPQASLQQTPPTAPATAEPVQTPETPHQTRPNPDASGKYHVGDGVSTPKLVHSVEPEIPEKLRKKKFNGMASCTGSMTVDTDGRTQDVHLIKSFPDSIDKKLHDAAIELQNTCIKAIKQYRFEPATYLGKPVTVETSVEITFPF